LWYKGSGILKFYKGIKFSYYLSFSSIFPLILGQVRAKKFPLLTLLLFKLLFLLLYFINYVLKSKLFHIKVIALPGYFEALVTVFSDTRTCKKLIVLLY